MKKVETFNNLLVYRNDYSKKFINDYILKNNLDGVRIFSPSEETKIADFSFLSEIEGLRELSIYYFDQIEFDFLYELKQLKKLHIQTLFSEIDFSKINQLEYLALQWNKKYILNLESLERLAVLLISEFDEKNLMLLKSLKSINFLSVKAAKCTSLDGVGELINLKGLAIGNFKNLVDVGGLAKLTKLKYIYLDGCPKLEEVGVIGKLVSLEILEFMDCKGLRDISFIENLKSLKQLSILGSTNVNNTDFKNIERLYVGQKNVSPENKRISFFNLINEK